MATSFENLPEKPKGSDFAMTLLLERMIKVINQLKAAVNDLEDKVDTLEGYH